MAVEPQVWRWTSEHFEAAAAAGVFGEKERVELLDGEVYEMAPIGNRHWVTTTRAQYALMERLARRALVSIQNAVVLGDLTEPQPDISVIRPGFERYTEANPGIDDVLLLIEVADTTLVFDRRKKIPLYARAGVSEAWIVDVNGETIEVYRDPGPDGYRDVRSYHRGDVISLLAFPDLTIPVDEILG